MSENEKYISRSDEMGSIHISTEVLAVIAAAAAAEVDGVAGMAANLGSDMAERVVGRKPVAKGVRLVMNDDQLSLDLSILVKYGYVVPEVASAVQEAVASAVENTSGLKVSCVNVAVSGVVFPRGNG